MPRLLDRSLSLRLSWCDSVSHRFFCRCPTSSCPLPPGAGSVSRTGNHSKAVAITEPIASSPTTITGVFHVETTASHVEVRPADRARCHAATMESRPLLVSGWPLMRSLPGKTR